MSLKREYALLCDGCGVTTASGYESPRRARAAAKAVGWSRRKVIFPNYYWRNGERHSYDDRRGRDFCPSCTETYLEEENES